MPEQRTLERARRDRRQGRAPSTQAGEFVREEMEHIRQGKHGARSTKQAVAIGLSKARRAGVDLKAPKRGATSEATRKSAARAYARGHGAPARRRSTAKRVRATTQALKREGRSAASRTALARQAHTASSRRSSGERSAAARAAARTKGRSERSAAARKAARTRAGRDGKSARKWSAGVMQRSDALDLEGGVFKKPTAKQVAQSLKRSAQASGRRRSSPFRSAMSMLNFQINRGGKTLSAERRRVLSQAKAELRKAFHRESART